MRLLKSGALVISGFWLVACSTAAISPEPTINVPTVTLAAPTTVKPTNAATATILAPTVTRPPLTIVPATGASTTSITIVMKEFSFDPRELTVSVGTRVRLELQSRGSYPHNFILGALGIFSTGVPPEKSESLEFVVQQPGTFDFFCILDEPSSHLEAGMRGTLTVR